MLHLLGQAFQNAQEPKPNARYLCSCLLLYHCATHSPKEKVPKPTMQSDSTGFFWYVLCNARRHGLSHFAVSMLYNTALRVGMQSKCERGGKSHQTMQLIAKNDFCGFFVVCFAQFRVGLIGHDEVL